MLLLLIPSLGYHGAARQLSLLATQLPRDRFDVRVCCLGPSTPWADDLRRAGLTVDALGWRRLVDPLPFLRLRQVLQSVQPDLVHAWSLASLRALALVGSRVPCVLAAPFAGAQWHERPAWLDRRLLSRALRVVVHSEGEASICRRLGVPGDQLSVIRPGVAEASTAPTDLDVELPGDAKCIVALGPIAAHKGFWEIAWGFDVIRPLYPELRVLATGNGTGMERLRHFIWHSGNTGNIHLLGERPAVQPYLERAHCVWVLPAVPAGTNAALEAMAAGKPVIASNVPPLNEIVIAGETGYLAPPGDKILPSRHTHELLQDVELARRLGEAGRRRAREHFSVAAMVERWSALYE